MLRLAGKRKGRSGPHPGDPLQLHPRSVPLLDAKRMVLQASLSLPSEECLPLSAGLEA